jgi:hypothetical protein
VIHRVLAAPQTECWEFLLGRHSDGVLGCGHYFKAALGREIPVKRGISHPIPRVQPLFSR